MAPEKRTLPTKVSKMRARKRARLSKSHKASAEPSEIESEKTGIRLDDLNWIVVTPPNHLGDYEGFFGLEEIDNVDVVRTETGAKFFPKDAPSVVNVDEEWGGFEDVDEDSEVPQISHSLKPAIKKRKSVDHSEDSFGHVFLPDLFEDQGDNEDQNVDVSAWGSLKLPPRLLSSLSKVKFRNPTPIQASAIPHILDGHDLIGKAPTGSGKTLAFCLPIFHYWLENNEQNTLNGSRKHPIALIILPTRELAHQITEHLHDLTFDASEESPKLCTLTGGLSIQKQRRQFEQADIVVSTPGRLWELIEEGQNVLDFLKHIKFLVVDEADRLLSTGNFKELQRILEALDRDVLDENNEDSQMKASNSEPKRQTLVFSATFHKDLQQKLAKRTKFSSTEPLSTGNSMAWLLQKLNFRESNPKFVDINPVSQMVAGLREGLIQCPRGTEKDLYVYALISIYYPSSRSLVFVNSISAVRRLIPFFQNLGIQAFGLHSRMPQKSRLRSVERFSESQYGGTLVATDLAARGLDIPNIDLVIHYHLPRTSDTYIHRSGRTARASQTGSSIMICAPEEIAGVRRLVAQVHSNNQEEVKMIKSNHIQNLHIDNSIAARLKLRVSLSKRLSDAVMAKEKGHSEDEVLRRGAEDLGVDYSSDELERGSTVRSRGRTGRGRKTKEKEARSLTKAELQAIRTELKHLLAERLNMGVSARYLTAKGPVDVEKFIAGQDRGLFLGSVPDLGWEDR